MYDFGMNLKKRQHKVNRYLRAINKSIAEDNIWKGRFEFKQFDRSWYVFEDGSGAILTVFIEAYDKSTGIRTAYGVETTNLNKLWYLANDFITKEVKAPCKYVGDFTKVTPVFEGKKNFDFVRWVH